MGQMVHQHKRARLGFLPILDLANRRRVRPRSAPVGIHAFKHAEVLSALSGPRRHRPLHIDRLIASAVLSEQIVQERLQKR